MKSEDFNIENNSEESRNMYYGASPILFELAKQLRGKMTEAEEILWNKININEWHLKFRRQHPIAIYVADFYCHQLKLVIELDGGYHENKEVKIYDKAREKDIKQFGINILRFKNEEVMFNMQEVLNKIRNAITSIQATAQKESKSQTNLQDTIEEEARGSKNSPPRRTGGKAGSSKIPPLGDGGGDGGSSLFVIKIGGNVIDNDTALQSFLKDFATIKAKKILVHGGGKIATKIGEQLGIQPNYINGRRITDAATLDLVTMVYGGLINKKIVAKLQSFNCNAIGLTGADANIIPATKRPVITSPIKDIAKETGSLNNPPPQRTGVDYGFAGDINTETIGFDNLNILLTNNFTLVFAPLTHDGNGQILNTNADTIASALAVALSKKYEVRLIYCFEKKGVLENVDDENSVIPFITKEKYHQLVQDNKLFDGILPKIDNAFAAIGQGVREVLIGDANDLLQNVTANTRGTLIK